MKNFLRIEIKTLNIIKEAEHDIQRAYEADVVRKDYCDAYRDALHKIYATLSDSYDTFNTIYISQKLKGGLDE